MPARIRTALVWTAAFAFSLALFLLLSKYLRVLPPTEPVAVGRVTVEKASKLRDYLTAAIFYLLVPLATVGFARAGDRFLRRVIPKGTEMLGALLFAIPFWLSPFFYLTTRKEGWTVLLPVILGAGAAFGVRWWITRSWLRRIFSGDLRVSHALLLTEAVSWVVFRYVATGKRIAHFDTLFLELVFIVFFMLVWWTAAIVVSIAAARLRGERAEEVLPRFAAGASPLVTLPVLALTSLPVPAIALFAIAASVAGAVVAIQLARAPSARAVRFALAWIIIPVVLFSINVASVASPWHWTDLFHRGESLGPASDYLRGKVPYRDVFVLHGMLDDGVLDAFLMRIFGRGAHVAVWRLVILDSVGLGAVWLLSMAALRSMPLSIAALAVAMVTSVGSQRVVMQIISVALLVGAVRSGRTLLMGLCGVFASAALFYSLETGTYAMLGAALSMAGLALIRSRRAGELKLDPVRGALALAAGVIAGALPFVVWLATEGALTAFLRTSFVTVPSIIDAVWSLPFPKLGQTFRDDPSLRTISDFILGERLRFILNPAVLGIALIYLIARFMKRNLTLSDQVLLALAVCGVVTQRSALGRADFPHQYFSAFLIGPILVMLLAALAQRLREVARRGDEGLAFTWLFVFSLAPLLFVSLWVPDLMNARINDMAAYRSRVAGGGTLDPAYLEVLKRVDGIREAVGGIVPAGEPIFDFSNQPALYFFADRPNPTRFYQVPILSPPAFQREAIVDLERARPAVVLRRSPTDFDLFDGISNEMRAPALAAYIDDAYEFAEVVRGVELWRRKPGAKPPDLRRYLARHRIPSPVEAASVRRDRIIFPAVGSLEGIGGSDWRTDLSLHNPHAASLTLRVRYLSRKRHEIDVTVGPNSVRNFDDVVSTLFGARGTSGALVLDVPASTPVIARARTRDVGLGGSAPLLAPMTASDSASATGERRSLVMSGFPSGGRLNIGVMNVGITPARFTIAALHNEGWPAGKRTIHAGAQEQDSYFLGQAEIPLGASVDPNLIIRIDVEQGAIIGYASVVDGATGDSVVVPGVPVAGTR